MSLYPEKPTSQKTGMGSLPWLRVLFLSSCITAAFGAALYLAHLLLMENNRANTGIYFFIVTSVFLCSFTISMYPFFRDLKQIKQVEKEVQIEKAMRAFSDPYNREYRKRYKRVPECKEVKETVDDVISA